ncbi:50S ribosomal protein L11 methyltransferase [Puniceicoccaceae bacterium K14]|nr:50S ribosomal protein L11 methyltransferase [Puniceicoccaceae bacterium K14]
MDFYFDSYSEVSLQRIMVSDRPRTGAFAEAIREVVKSGDKVLDLGTGTGLLAMLSAKAGAQKVFAVDQAGIAGAAEKLVAANKLNDRIKVINSNANQLKLDEPVDLLVSEWLGHFAFAETMLDDVITCRDVNLKPGGTMLPSGVEISLAPIDSEILYDEQGPGFWSEPVQSIDFSLLEKVELDQSIAVKTMVLPDDLLDDGKPIIALDLATATKESPWQSGEVEFVMKRDGQLNGFAGWFSAQLSPSVVLDTGPHNPRTHWEQTYFPMPTVVVEEGQRIKVKYSLTRHPVEPRGLLFDIEFNDIRHVFTIG